MKGPQPAGTFQKHPGEAAGFPNQNKPRFFVAEFFNSLLDAKVLNSREWKALTLHQVVYREVVLPPDFAQASKLNRDLASKFSIQSVPTLVVVSPSGAEMGRRPAAGTSATQAVKWIREIAGQGGPPGFMTGL